MKCCKHYFGVFVCLTFCILFFSCQNGDDAENFKIPEDNVERPTIVVFEQTTYEGTYGNVEIINSDFVDDNYILVNDIGKNRVYLMDKKGEVLHEWPLQNKLGNDAFMAPNDRLLASLEADSAKLKFGGQAGKLQLLDQNGGIQWDFNYSFENSETHHDAEMLPNGNILVLVWEKKKSTEAKSAGYILNKDVYPEAITEIDPTTNRIIWEWHAWNHLIQDYDSDKLNFGAIPENPQLIDLNYAPKENGDIMHANGIGYDATKDLIFISVNFYHEVWVIDHSTTSEQATSHSGGNYNKGGDLVYRFGNPMAYKNFSGERLFYNVHFPNVLTGNDQGKLLTFSNGNGLNPEQSTIYEIELPNPLRLNPNSNNEPEVLWSFTNKELFSAKVSGAVKLSNGNRLITEGDYGIWEVTEKGEVVWKYSGEGFFWRAYHFDKDSPQIRALGF